MPVRSPDFFSLAGSKIALSEISQRLGIAIPEFETAASLRELRQLLADSAHDTLVKANIEGGGARVSEFRAEHQGSLGKIDESWLTVLLQRKVTCVAIAVEAQFVSRKLVGWIYSKPLRTSTKFGPSTRRMYCGPSSFDFEQTLERLAETANLHCFPSVTFIQGQVDNRHYLIEADLRPNAWHQFDPQLGVHWSENLTHNPAEKLSRQHRLTE